MREREERGREREGAEGKGGDVEREGGEPPHFYNEVYAYDR